MSTAERIVDIIDMLASEAGPCGVSEISRQLDIGKNSVFRILSALECKKWVWQDNQTKKYNLTGAVAGVALKAISQLDIQEVSLPYLHELQAVTRETSALSLRMDLERMFINTVPSNRNVRHVPTLGESRPLWYGSGGKVILAFMSEEEIEVVLEQFKNSGVTALARGQVITVESLREEITQIKKQGYAVAAGEHNPEVCGVAAPILNHEQDVVGSIGLSGPMPRFDKEYALQHSTLLVETANKISTILGAKIE